MAEVVAMEARSADSPTVVHREWPHLDVVVLQLDGAAVVEVVGGIDPVSADHLADELVTLVESGSRHFAVDLSGVRSRDTSILCPLARLHAALKERNGQLYIVVDDDETLHRLHGSGFDRLAPVFLTRRYRDHLVQEYGKYLSETGR